MPTPRAVRVVLVLAFLLVGGLNALEKSVLSERRETQMLKRTILAVVAVFITWSVLDFMPVPNFRPLKVGKPMS